MIDDVKKSYIEYVDRLIPNWKKINKNELAFKYIENESNEILRSAYYVALVLKYWNRAINYAKKCFYNPPLEYGLDWLYNTLDYVLKMRQWENPESSLYGDKNAPDKAINLVLRNRYWNYTNSAKKMKHVANINTVSTDDLYDKYNDYSLNFSKTYDLDRDGVYLIDYIKTAFEHKDYSLAFMVDLILNFDVFDDKLVLSKSKIISLMVNIDDNYCFQFSSTYDFPIDKVKKASTYITRMDRKSIGHIVDTKLEYLKRYYSKSEGFINAY